MFNSDLRLQIMLSYCWQIKKRVGILLCLLALNSKLSLLLYFRRCQEGRPTFTPMIEKSICLTEDMVNNTPNFRKAKTKY